MQAHTKLGWILSALVVSSLVACGDDTGTGGTGGGDGGSGATGGTGGEGATGAGDTNGGGGEGATGAAGGGGGDGGGGGEPMFVAPQPIKVPLSPAGPDQLMSVAVASDGDFVAAGWVSFAIGAPKQVFVTKFGPMGHDPDFGEQGVALTDLVFAGGNDEIDIVAQSDGRIVVSATVPALIQGDRDVAVTRLNEDGETDGTFGDEGVRSLSLNNGVIGGNGLTAMDGARSLAVDDDDQLFLHAVSRALDPDVGLPRTDTDFVVVKFTENGTVDGEFGDEGQVRFDIQQANATPRGIHTFPDGTLIASGYANTPDLGTVQAVLYKLDANGDFVDDFDGEDGYWHEIVLQAQTEIYNFAVHGDHLVTAGYGRNEAAADAPNQYVSLRFAIEDGERDTDWGGETNGAVLVDPSGAAATNNARNAIGLPSGTTLMIGSTGAANTTAQTAVFVALDEDGELDAAFGDGIHTFELGTDGGGQLWGGTVSGDFVALVGYRGIFENASATLNDDSYVLVFEAP